jgi:hypothetical protein
MHTLQRRSLLCTGLAFFSLIIASLLSGCATTLPTPEQLAHGNNDIKHCRSLYTAFTQQVTLAKVHDSQTEAIPHFPYLHVDRFLATYKPQPTNRDKYNEWLKLSRQQALHTQTIEYRNLPEQNKAQLQQSVQSLFDQPHGVLAQLEMCSDTLSQQELHNNALRQSVYQNAAFPSDYQTWQRIVGLYAITALPFAAGIGNWHEESTAALLQPYDSIAFKGKDLRYHPSPTDSLSRKAVAALIRKSANNPLGIPQFSAQERAALFATYAPVIEVDTVSDDDRIGTPFINTERQKNVDTSKVHVYTHLSYSLFAGKVLPQLNYIFWFPARPCTSSFDLLCGHLDGLTWRVTLAADGTPLHYDSIHNCGCYHTFFPTALIRKKPRPDSFEEWAFTPVNAPQIIEKQRLLIRLASRTHYVIALGITQNPSQKTVQEIRYTFADYDNLRSLPVSGAGNARKWPRQGLFGEDGIIASSRRKERFLYWPMGIPSPGAMRQWGHHATAFVGRRFFDDPCLLERYYTPAISSTSIHGSFHPPGIPDEFCPTNYSEYVSP